MIVLPRQIVVYKNVIHRAGETLPLDYQEPLTEDEIKHLEHFKTYSIKKKKSSKEQ